MNQLEHYHVYQLVMIAIVNMFFSIHYHSKIFKFLDGFNNNNNDSVSFYCRFRLLPEKRSLFQTKIVRLTRLQTSYLFDKKQLNEFELTYDQLNNHSIEIFLYKIHSVKPLYKDIRLATVKYDLNELTTTDQSRMKKSIR